MTESQQLLKIHLSELGIETVAEFQFCPDRRFRFDLANEQLMLGFECNGSWNGLHGPRWSSLDAEKSNLAQAKGWCVFVFSNKQVLNGEAKAFLEANLNLPSL